MLAPISWLKDFVDIDCTPDVLSDKLVGIGFEVEEKETYIPQRKDLTILLAELEDIKNTIDDIKARQWHLAEQMKFHNEGISPE